MALSWWPGHGPVAGAGSQPCLACLPADSSGTVSWLPAKLLPLPAGCHPGPSARGPAGGQQLQRCRSVNPARRLQAGLGVEASNRPLQPFPGELGTAAPDLALPPKLGPPQSPEEQTYRSNSKVSTARTEDAWSRAESLVASTSASGKWNQFIPSWPVSHDMHRASVPGCPWAQDL